MILTMIGEATILKLISPFHNFFVLLIKHAEEAQSAKGTLNKKTSHSLNCTPSSRQWK